MKRISKATMRKFAELVAAVLVSLADRRVTPQEGAAIILEGDDTARVSRAVSTKYKIGWALLSTWTRLQQMLGRDDGIADRAIKVTLHA